MDNLKLFMDEADVKTVDKFYEEDGDNLVLKDKVSEEDRDKLNDIFGKPMVIVSTLTSDSKETKAALAKMDIPEAMVKKSTDDMMNQYAQDLAAQGLSMDIYFQYTGMTPQQLAEQMKPQALANIKNRLVLDAIAAAENVEITDEEIEAEIKRLAETWKMEADKVREYMDVDLMRKDMSAQKALDMITDAAVEK